LEARRPFFVPTIGLLPPLLQYHPSDAEVLLSLFFVFVGVVIGIPDPAAIAVEADPCDEQLILLLLLFLLAFVTRVSLFIIAED
jgi:hypothetical protein